MQNLRQQLPPLDPLVAFEAAARLMSFTRAAEELHLSQAAVSQQIRNLEQHLGIDLFTRSHKSVRLTARGREFQHTVSQTLRQLASATQELKQEGPHSRLSLSADQSAASMWLMPRLPGFQKEYPEISVRLLASDDENDCLGKDVHTAIIHGSGKWPGFLSEKLFGEEIFPVCSPNYLKCPAPLPDAKSLVDEILLDLDDTHWNWMNWRTWLNLNEVHLPAQHRSLQVNSYPLLIEAAKNGQGIALGWKHLVDAELEKGTLVKVLEAVVTTSNGYYLVWPESDRQDGNADLFRKWCIEQVPG